MLNNKIIKTKYTPNVNLSCIGADDTYRLIQYAQNYAIKLLQQTRIKAAKQILKTKDRSKRIGYKIGKENASLELAEQIKNQTFSYNEYTKNLKEDCFNISLKIVENVLQKEMKKSSKSLYNRINKVLNSITDKYNIKIFVNPLDYPRLLKIEPKLQESLTEEKTVKIGNALITSPIGNSEINWQEHFKLLSDIIQTQLNINKIPEKYNEK